MSDFRDVLLVVLGWLLGTLSPGIGRAITRSRRRDELLKGIRHECVELRFTLANALFSTRRALRELDQTTLDIVKPILVQYRGTTDQDLVALAKRLFEQPDANVISWGNSEQLQSRDKFGRPLGQWPVPYELALLSHHIGELDLFSVQQQEAFLRVEAELRFFNEQVEYVRSLHEKTFTTTGANHQLNEDNLLAARRTLGKRETTLIGALNSALAASGHQEAGAAR